MMHWEARLRGLQFVPHAFCVKVRICVSLPAGSGGRYADRVQAFANGTRAGGFDRQPYSRGWGRENHNAVPYDYQEPAGGRYRRY